MRYAVLFLLMLTTNTCYADLSQSTEWTEEDGSPSIFNPYQVRFANGNLTDNLDGTLSIAGGSGAPTTADYLVGTTDAGLSAEIVVGTTPGGELGNTWASPTLDDSVTVTGWVMGASTATTPSVDDSDTSLATTAFVNSEIVDDLDTSAEVAAVVTDETGTSLLVFNTDPAIVAPAISGTPNAAGELGYNTTQAMQTTYGGITAVVAPIHGTIASGVGTETLTDSTASEQNFTSMYTFPANSIYTGKVYRITIYIEEITGTSTNTRAFHLKLGSTVVYTQTAANQNNGLTRSCAYAFHIFGRAAAGAAANVSIGCDSALNAGGNVNNTNQPIALATNGTLTINLGVTYSGTGSTETVEQQAFLIEEIN